MTNFREKLDELNTQAAKFDEMQVQVDEAQGTIARLKEERDKSLDAVHDLVRALNEMLPTRPVEEEKPAEPEALRAWQGNNY